MRIEVGFLDDPASLAIGEARGNEPIRWTGPGAIQAQSLASHYAGDYGLQGEELLRYLTVALGSRSNWAVELPPSGGEQRPPFEYDEYDEGDVPQPDAPAQPRQAQPQQTHQDVHNNYVVHGRDYQPLMSFGFRPSERPGSQTRYDMHVHLASGQQPVSGEPRFRWEASHQGGTLLRHGRWEPSPDAAHQGAMLFHGSLGGHAGEARGGAPEVDISHGALARREIPSLSRKSLHFLSGLPADAEVTQADHPLRPHNPDDRGTWYSNDKTQPWLSRKFELNHPYLDPGWRLKMAAGLDREGRRLLHLSGIGTSKRGGDRMGLRLTAQQVTNAMHRGFNYMAMHAAGNSGSASIGEPGNGYSTWAQSGYNEPIASLEQHRTSQMVADRIKRTFGDFRSPQGGPHSVLDVVELPSVMPFLGPQELAYTRRRLQEIDRHRGVSDVMAGRRARPIRPFDLITGHNWWTAWGGDMNDARFDLTPGSQSHRVLQRYMREHGYPMPGPGHLA